MRVAVIMHVENEGPGLFGPRLAAAGVDVRTVRLHRGEALPAPAQLDAAICLGGPMNVYEEQAHPFLGAETLWLRQAAAHALPVLGVCLGAQLIAKAAGAPVTKNPVQELGWGAVRLTAEARSDPLLRGLPRVLPVFQWHGDTFAIPDGGVLLATGADCRNQALRVGSSWGLQFHVEVDRPLLSSWFAGTPHEAPALGRLAAVGAECGRNAALLLDNFLAIARGPRH